MCYITRGLLVICTSVVEAKIMELFKNYVQREVDLLWKNARAILYHVKHEWQIGHAISRKYRTSNTEHRTSNIVQIAANSELPMAYIYVLWRGEVYCTVCPYVAKRRLFPYVIYPCIFTCLPFKGGCVINPFCANLEFPTGLFLYHPVFSSVLEI